MVIELVAETPSAPVPLTALQTSAGSIVASRENIGQGVSSPILATTAPVAATPVVPVVIRQVHGKPVDESDVDGGSIATIAFAPPIDLLVESPVAADYISGAQAISVGLPATTPYRAATAEYDLRPLGDKLISGSASDPVTGGLNTPIGADDLLVDVLAESSMI